MRDNLNREDNRLLAFFGMRRSPGVEVLSYQAWCSDTAPVKKNVFYNMMKPMYAVIAQYWVVFCQAL